MLRFLFLDGRIWPVVVLFGIIAIVCLAMAQYKMVGDEVRHRYNERMFSFVATITAVTMAVIMYVQDGALIITALDNMLAADDRTGFWALFLSPWVSLIAGTSVYMVLYYMGRAIGHWRMKCLLYEGEYEYDDEPDQAKK